MNEINKNTVVLYPSAHNTTYVVMYDTANTELRNFLSLFDIWGSKGEIKKSNYDNINNEIWFELNDIIDTTSMHLALNRLGVNVIYDN